MQITRASSGQPLAYNSGGIIRIIGVRGFHFTFPIAFSTVLNDIDGYSTTGTSDYYGYTKNIVINSFEMFIDASETGRYIAIGI